MMAKIPIAGPSITQKEIDYVSEAVKTAWYDNANVFHERFERAFAAHCGRKYAISLPSCTSGLHLALLALGIGEGDEVIVPDCTWIASVAPVHYVGATPVFADIDPDSWCLSSEAFESAISPRTKAAIVVDLYGAMPDWDRISEIAARHGIVLIEDAAEAAGSLWRERPAGSFGTMSAFSFHGSKTLTTGEGGMLVLDDDHLRTRVLQLRDHGRVPGDTMFFNEEVGWKYKMSSMQAALGLAQLERLDELVGKKRQIFSWYRQALADWNLRHAQPRCAGSVQFLLDDDHFARRRTRHQKGDAGAAAAAAGCRRASLLLSVECDTGIPRYARSSESAKDQQGCLLRITLCH